MCRLCDEGHPQDHTRPRRNFFKSAAGAGLAATAFELLAAGAANANQREEREPEDSGQRCAGICKGSPAFRQRAEFL